MAPTIATPQGWVGRAWSSEANKDCSESNQSNRYGCFEKGGDTAITRETVNSYRIPCGKNESSRAGSQLFTSVQRFEQVPSKGSQIDGPDLLEGGVARRPSARKAKLRTWVVCDHNKATSEGGCRARGSLRDSCHLPCRHPCVCLCVCVRARELPSRIRVE